MKTIDSLDLELVTGGTSHPLPTIGRNTAAAAGGNDQLLSTLQGIQSSLADLGKNQGGLFSGPNGALLMMTMALALSRRNDVVVYGGGHRRGWSVRAWW